MTPESYGLDGPQIAAWGTAFGMFAAAAFAAWRGHKAKHKEAVVSVPKAAIPDDLQEQIDNIENRVEHTEPKIDKMIDMLHAIQLDTQVLRAMKGG